MIRAFTSNYQMPLPPDKATALRARLAAMTPEELAAFANQHSIEIGGATSVRGILAKISPHLEALAEAEDA